MSSGDTEHALVASHLLPWRQLLSFSPHVWCRRRVKVKHSSWEPGQHLCLIKTGYNLPVVIHDSMSVRLLRYIGTCCVMKYAPLMCLLSCN